MCKSCFRGIERLSVHEKQARELKGAINTSLPSTNDFKTFFFFFFVVVHRHSHTKTASVINRSTLSSASLWEPASATSLLAFALLARQSILSRFAINILGRVK